MVMTMKATPFQARQVDAFWQRVHRDARRYLIAAHGIPAAEAEDLAAAVVAQERRRAAVLDLDAATATTLERLDEAMAAETVHRRAALPVAGLPMTARPLAPVVSARPERLAALIRWGSASAAGGLLLLPGVTAALGLW